MLQTTSTHRRYWKPVALLMAALMMAGALVGCGGDDDTASTTTAAQTPDGGADAVETLATECREVDLAEVEQAADRFLAAQNSTDDATTESEVATAIVTLLDAGSALFATMATSLTPLFDALADAAGQPSIAEVPDSLLAAADEFSELASDIDDAGTLTEADVARIDDVGTRLDELDNVIEVDSDAGRELRRVPACETFIRNFDAVFAGLDGEGEINDSTTGGSGSGDVSEGVNTDVADGICDQDRWLQDPDCGNSSVANSDLADGTCDDSRFFTDPDC